MIQEEVFSLGPFSSIYVGDADASDILTQVTAQRTEGGVFRAFQSMRFNDARNKYTPAGRAQVTCDLTFYGGGDQATALSCGNSFSSWTGVPDAPGGCTQYALLLIHTNEDLNLSLWIPRIETDRDLTIPAGRGTFAPVHIHFKFEGRNSFKNLFYKRDAATAASLAGARNPLA